MSNHIEFMSYNSDKVLKLLHKLVEKNEIELVVEICELLNVKRFCIDGTVIYCKDH